MPDFIGINLEVKEIIYLVFMKDSVTSVLMVK